MAEHKSQGYGSKSLSAGAIRDIVDGMVPGIYNAQPGVKAITHVLQLDTKDRAKFRKLARARHAEYN